MLLLLLLDTTWGAGETKGRGWSSPESLEELGIKVGLHSTDGTVVLDKPPKKEVARKDSSSGTDANGEEEIVVPAVVLTHTEFEAANPMSAGAKVVRAVLKQQLLLYFAYQYFSSTATSPATTLQGFIATDHANIHPANTLTLGWRLKADSMMTFPNISNMYYVFFLKGARQRLGLG